MLQILLAAYRSEDHGVGDEKLLRPEREIHVSDDQRDKRDAG